MRDLTDSDYENIKINDMSPTNDVDCYRSSPGATYRRLEKIHLLERNGGDIAELASISIAAKYRFGIRLVIRSSVFDDF